MDIRLTAQILLRDAQYTVSTWRDASGPILRFEDASVIGFLYEFDTVADLLLLHASREQSVLTAHAHALRAAGQKAWNIYSVFVTSEIDVTKTHSVAAIDEDLQTTRKLAKTGIVTEAALTFALLPLLPISSQPQIANDDYENRVKRALSNLADGTLADSFFGPMAPQELLNSLLKSS